MKPYRVVIAAFGVAAALSGCARAPVMPPPMRVDDKCLHGRPDVAAIRRVAAAIDDGNSLKGGGRHILEKYLREDGGVIVAWSASVLASRMSNAHRIYHDRWNRSLTGRVAIADVPERILGERWVSTEVRTGSFRGWIDTLSHDTEPVCKTR